MAPLELAPTDSAPGIRPTDKAEARYGGPSLGRNDWRMPMRIRREET